MHCGWTFSVRGVTAKPGQNSFSFTISLIDDSFLSWSLAASANKCFSFLIKSRIFTISFQEALYGSTLAYPNCQNHYSWALRSLLCKIGFPWWLTQTVKNLPAMQVTWVWSLGWEDPLEKEMATHSNILAWRIPWTEEPGGYSPWVVKGRIWLSN